MFALNCRTQQSASDKLFYVVPHLHAVLLISVASNLPSSIIGLAKVHVFKEDIGQMRSVDAT